MQDPARAGNTSVVFYVRNPRRTMMQVRLRVQATGDFKYGVTGAPVGKTFPLAPGKELLVQISIKAPNPEACGRVSVYQDEVIDKRRVRTLG